MLTTRPTIGRMVQDARAILNDTVPISGSVRYTDEDLIQAFNTALMEIRAKRPDAFLDMGLRIDVPQFVLPDDVNMAFPIMLTFYPLCVYYIAGKSEIREDEMSQEGRAAALMSKFITGLMQVTS